MVVLRRTGSISRIVAKVFLPSMLQFLEETNQHAAGLHPDAPGSALVLTGSCTSLDRIRESCGGRAYP